MIILQVMEGEDGEMLVVEPNLAIVQVLPSSDEWRTQFYTRQVEELRVMKQNHFTYLKKPSISLFHTCPFRFIIYLYYQFVENRIYFN